MRQCSSDNTSQAQHKKVGICKQVCPFVHGDCETAAQIKQSALAQDGQCSHDDFLKLGDSFVAAAQVRQVDNRQHATLDDSPDESYSSALKTVLILS